MNIDEKLKKMRTERGLTQREVADCSDIERVSYNRYENGTRVPTIDAVVKLASFFGCTTDYLLGVTEEPNLVRFDTGVDYEGDRVYIDIVKEYLDKGLSKEDIDELIQMGLAWKKASEEITKKPNKD